ncbi:MAG TPA: tetratricopeptide repeat protein [Terriglobales bacterium]|nr:tetratricopeptide repeat protein [Terriglobales bacterium]
MRACTHIPALLVALAVAAAGQTRTIGSGQTVRHHKETVQQSSPEVDQAEAALEKQDLATAEQLLTKAVAAHANDYRAWYDLGYVYNATGRSDQAIEAYRKSVAAKPEVFESNLNLGLLLARRNDPDAAIFLRKATQLKPTAQPEQGLERAWLSLGHVLEKTDAGGALQAFAKAAALQPKDPEPHLSAAMLLEQRNDLAGAGKEYRAAAELDPKSDEALAGVVNVASKSGKLAEAEEALRHYLQLTPQSATAQAQLARVMILEKKPEAREQLEAALRVNPGDKVLRREYVTYLIQDKQYDKAESEVRTLMAAAPNDSSLHHFLGVILLNQHKYQEAQPELVEALKLDPRLTAAYGDLATTAYENKNYPLTIRALDAQAKLAPESPGSYFLRAQAYDQLKDWQHAAENYRQFLAVSNGRFPDNEWKARHRLIAIDPDAKKK